jgi:hypothetical protein
MTRAELLLKRHKDYLQGEGYLVFFDDRCVGRIFNADAGAPKDQPWFWGLEFHEWQGSEARNTGTSRALMRQCKHFVMLGGVGQPRNGKVASDDR